MRENPHSLLYVKCDLSKEELIEGLEVWLDCPDLCKAKEEAINLMLAFIDDWKVRSLYHQINKRVK